MPQRKPKISSIPDRIRGSIAIFLTITAFTLGNYATDAQWQGTCVIAGMFYMITSIAYVFKDVDSFEE